MICADHPYTQFLSKVQRPQQYTGGEWNLDTGLSGKPKVTLVYPDIYELGMSNFGLVILRHILLSSGQFDVRRAFCPAPDMDEIIVRESLDWVDLEGYDPVRKSRVVGFGISSEALYTNALHLITRMGLPLRSIDRDDNAPIILFGGGGLGNPLPLAPFADIFFLGEVEERGVDLFSILAGAGSSSERLKKADEIPGVYVPVLGKKQVEIQRIRSLRMEYAPVRQLVPNSKVSQDRAVIEIARGCTRGCRFCQASQLYRPVRERPTEEAVDLMDRTLKSTGWEKSGLLTLSLSDYSRLPLLLSGMDMLAEKHHVSIGRPSMRPDTINRLEEGRSITGRITIAPEAGTESLRRKINKPMSDEVILNAVDTVFRMGAKGVKLYFMVGLPEESDEDVTGIGELVLKIAGIARSHGRNPRKNITAALSPFVPKAQTPLQWSPQMDENELWRRIRMVRKICGRKVSLSWNSPNVAIIEGLLSLGNDGDTADMLEKAVLLGARFDAWTDRFRWDIWKDLIQGYDHLLARLQAGIESGEDLPWSFISTGVSEAFLKAENKRYAEGRNTPDCREEGCRGCGACSGTGDSRETHVRDYPTDHSVSSAKRVAVLRVRYSKTDCTAYTSHLDMVRMWGRALRRSDLPVLWSDGYVSRPRVHFGPPLPLGIESIAEYIDIELNTIPGSGAEELLNRFMPAGLRVEETWTLSPDTPAPDGGSVSAGYSVSSDSGLWTVEEVERTAESLGNNEHVLSVNVKDSSVVLFTTRTDSRKSRPDLLLSEILDYQVRIKRTDIYISYDSNCWRSIRSYSRDLEKMFFES